MKELTLKEISKATGGRLISGNCKDHVDRVSIDSRETAPGQLFIPIIGDKYDAHRFLAQVVESGCRSFIVSDEKAADSFEKQGNINIILVEDTTVALQDLAAYYLDVLGIKKIAVTGSVGKTTTRDMIYSVCAEKYKTAKNKGNLNNLIGVPLTALSIEEGTEVGVFEMGMDRPGEIKRLTEIVRPDIGVITNIGVAHIENLGSREAIFKAKMELADTLGPEDILVIGSDEEFLTKERIKGNYKVITAGLRKNDDYRISHIDEQGAGGIQFTVEYANLSHDYKLPIPGKHNAVDALLAIATGKLLGVTEEQAATGLKKAVLTDKRQTVIREKGLTLIDDTYNASPDSMKAALDTLGSFEGKRKTAILGDMLELGENSDMYHRQIGDYAIEKKLDLLVCVGKEAKGIFDAAHARGSSCVCRYYLDKEKFYDDKDDLIKVGDVILVKGSRGMAMDEIVEKIIKQ